MVDIPERLLENTVKAILKHAEDGYPEEICGVVVVDERGLEKYVRCVNVAKEPTQDFKMEPQSFIDAEDIGEVVGIVHSHPDGTSAPSPHDVAIMSINREIEVSINPESNPIPWHIVSWPEGDYRQVMPQEQNSLLGRQFVHGVWDCWQACADYYKRYHNIKFPRYEREDCWWEVKDGPSHYEDLYEAGGFYRVEDLQVGDLVIMQIGRTFHPNHAGVYLGNTSEFEGRGLHGGPFMLHHMYGKKSDIVVFGGQWEQRTRFILRHKEIKNG